MADPLPPNLLAEHTNLVAEIHDAFRGVTRVGGVSWTETYAIDDYEGPDECAAARALDREPGWEHLVDDPKWLTEQLAGGITFLDAIGFRYYIAPLMLRAMRERSGDFLASSLTLKEEAECAELSRSQWRLLNDRQSLCIARFLQFMDAVEDLEDLPCGQWEQALNRYWRRFLPRKERRADAL